jgi:hypothetical protein
MCVLVYTVIVLHRLANGEELKRKPSTVKLDCLVKAPVLFVGHHETKYYTISLPTKTMQLAENILARCMEYRHLDHKDTTII